MRRAIGRWIAVFILGASSVAQGAAQSGGSARPVAWPEPPLEIAAETRTEPSPIAADTTPPGVCFRGGPLPRCGSFLIAEYGLGVGVGAELGGSRGGFVNVTAQLGWMANRGDGTARGGTALLVWENHRLMLGGAYRHRWWLKDWLALDLAPGVVTSIDGKRGPIPVGVIGHAAVSAADLVSVYAQIQTLYVRDPSDGDAVPALLVVGVGTGSYAAVGLGAATGALAWWASQFD